MKLIKRNFYAFIAITALVVSALFFLVINQIYSQSGDAAATATKVGHFYLGNNNASQNRSLLGVEVPKWEATVSYEIQMQEVKYTIQKLEIADTLDIDSDGILIEKIAIFDLDETVKGIEPNTENLAIFNDNQTAKTLLLNDLEANFGSELISDLDFTKLSNDILVSAKNLTRKRIFQLYDYLSSSWKESLVSSITLENLEAEDIDAVIEILQDINKANGNVVQDLPNNDDEVGKTQIIIPPQSLTKNSLGFSTIAFVNDYYINQKAVINALSITEMEKAILIDQLGERLNIIVTGLAAVIQKTSFYVTVKNQSLIELPYAYGDVTPGDDKYDGMTAIIKMGTTPSDFRFINPEESSYYVELKEVFGSTSELTFELYGCRYLKKYSTTFEVEYLVKEQILTLFNELSEDISEVTFIEEVDPFNPISGLVVTKDSILGDQNGMGYYYQLDEVGGEFTGEFGKLITYYRLVLVPLSEGGVPTYGTKEEGGIVYAIEEKEPIYREQEFYEATANSGRMKALTTEMAIYIANNLIEAWNLDEDPRWPGYEGGK